MMIDLSLYNTLITFVISFEPIASFSSMARVFTDSIMEMVNGVTDNRGPFLLSLLMKPALLHVIPSIESVVVETTNLEDSEYVCSILENCETCHCDALLLQMIEDMKSFSGKRWMDVLRVASIRDCQVMHDAMKQIIDYVL